MIDCFMDKVMPYFITFLLFVVVAAVVGGAWCGVNSYYESRQYSEATQNNTVVNGIGYKYDNFTLMRIDVDPTPAQMEFLSKLGPEDRYEMTYSGDVVLVWDYEPLIR